MKVFSSSKKLPTNPEMGDSQQQKGSQQVCGIEAIFSNSVFSNKASSMYLYEVHSYLDVEHPSLVTQQLKHEDPNLVYSLNISALWLLLKDKLKMFSRARIFERTTDKIIVKFSIIYASVLCLNDAKEKIMQKQREDLRRDIKSYIHNKLKNEVKRRSSILEEFDKSEFFNKEIVDKLKLSEKEKQALKVALVDFKLQKNTTTVSYLQKILSFLQKSVRNSEIQLSKKGESQVNMQRSKRQAYSIFLLCTYLNIYLVFGDWISVLLKDKSKAIGKLHFFNLIDRKGLHIVNRVLDDAPLNIIGQEIGSLQEIYYK